MSLRPGKKKFSFALTETAFWKRVFENGTFDCVAEKYKQMLESAHLKIWEQFYRLKNRFSQMLNVKGFWILLKKVKIVGSHWFVIATSRYTRWWKFSKKTKRKFFELITGWGLKIHNLN